MLPVRCGTSGACSGLVRPFLKALFVMIRWGGSLQQHDSSAPATQRIRR
jgi:hypothetical protein